MNKNIHNIKQLKGLFGKEYNNFYDNSKLL